MDAEKLPGIPEPPLAVAVSQCLTGSHVRYDGGQKREAMPHEVLNDLYIFRAICPEVGIGLGVPRDPIPLVGDPDMPRARVFAKGSAISHGDVTDELREYADAQLPLLDEVDGYVFMKGSPSCGLSGVEVFEGDGPGSARGVYAAQIVRRRPALPVVEGESLFDPARCANFVVRTFVYAHWRRTKAQGMSAARLIAFHTAYKYLVMAYDVPAYRKLGRLLSDLSDDVDRIASRYVFHLLAALSRPVSRTGHANSLAHLQGYVKREGSARREIAGLIEAYRCGKVPLSEPMSLLRQNLSGSGATHALNQAYLCPGLWAAVGRAYNGLQASSGVTRPCS